MRQEMLDKRLKSGGETGDMRQETVDSRCETGDRKHETGGGKQERGYMRGRQETEGRRWETRYGRQGNRRQ